MNRRSGPHPLLPAALALAALAGCGGGEREPPAEPPAALLAEAFANPVASGEAEIDVDLRLQGESAFAGEAFADLEGPFGNAGDGGLPDFDLELEGEAAGFGVDGRLVSTGEDAFVVFFGENYRVGPDNVSALESRVPPGATLGLSPREWLADPRYGDAEDVGGTETQLVQADLDGRAFAAQMETLAREVGAALPAALAAGAEQGVAEAWVAFDDRTIRRVRVQLTFTVPPGLVADAAGIESGAATIELEVSDVGAEVDIAPPPGGGFNPIEQLISRIRTLSGPAF